LLNRLNTVWKQVCVWRLTAIHWFRHCRRRKSGTVVSCVSDYAPFIMCVYSRLCKTLCNVCMMKFLDMWWCLDMIGPKILMLVIKWCLDLIFDVASWSCDVYKLMVFLVINHLFLIIKNDICYYNKWTKIRALLKKAKKMGWSS
jgi:hypothetical protein